MSFAFSDHIQHQAKVILQSKTYQDGCYNSSNGDNLSCGELLKGEVLGSSKAKRINNLPVDVEAIPPTVKD